MIWQAIETFPHSDHDCGFSQAALLCSTKNGMVVVGHSVRYDDLEGVTEYVFTYSREGLTFRPTHWAPLPDFPKKD